VSARLRPAGDRALLAEVGSLDEALSLARQVRGAIVELDDVIPAARSVLLVARRGSDLTAIADVVRGLDIGAPVPVVGEERVIDVPVVFDGPDLGDVSRTTGLTEHEVVAAVCATAWRAAFAGFTAGFCYLRGGDERLVVPRRREPRSHVPAGALALAGPYAAVYPRETPGGWQLVGRTSVAMWDLQRDPPALLTPGATVRFVEAD
jgi:KipI family sensor histidine kinase inhibitor